MFVHVTNTGCAPSWWSFFAAVFNGIVLCLSTMVAFDVDKMLILNITCDNALY